MSVEALVSELAGRGVELWFEGDRLRFRAPKGALGEAQRSQLAQQRAAVVEALRRAAEERVQTFPLSSSQQSLWFLHQQAPDSAAYHVALSMRLQSTVDVAGLGRAVQALVDRHASLRTSYVTDESGVPAQHVPGARRASLELFEVPGVDDADLKRRVEADYRRPFDLERDLMLRASLYQRGPTDSVLLITVHHIAADGWSLMIVLEELFKLYSEDTGGPPASLSRPALEYSDYVKWQAESLAGPEGERLWEAWRDRLAAPRPQLELPADRPRPRVQTFRGASLPLELGAELTASIKRLALAENTTPFVVLLGAFQVLLHRLSGAEDVIVGSPTFGRSKNEFMRVVGDFVNSVPLRSRPHGSTPFREFLGTLKETVLRALEAQDLPLPVIVQRLQPERDSSRSPLFDTLFVLQRFDQFKELQGLLTGDESEPAIELGGLRISGYPLDQQEGQFDLALQMVERDGSLHGVFKYSTDLFDRGTVQGFAKDFLALLAKLVENPASRLEELPEPSGKDTPAARARALLAALRARDVRLFVQGGKLRANAPKGAITPELQEQIANEREQLLALLENQTEADSGAVAAAIRPIPRTPPLPISAAQQRLWFLDRMQGGGPQYNIGLTVRLLGRVDAAALERAVAEVVRRHESLRTNIGERDGMADVVIRENCSWRLEHADLSGFGAEMEAEAARRVREHLATPFELARGSLVRTLLLRLGPDAFVFDLCMHHAITDGWSMLIALREICELYSAFAAGRAPELAPLSIQYVDYAAWERQRLHSGQLRPMLGYWKERLAGAPALLELPTDRPRPATQSFRGRRSLLEFDAELIESVKQFSRKHEATLFMTLLGVWQLLLHRVSGQDDVCVGSPVANRDRPELEAIIGCFVNNVVFRSSARDDESFLDYLRRQKTSVLSALDHRDLPFDVLVEGLKPERSSSHAPVFQVLFALQSYVERLPSIPGVELEFEQEADIGVSRFDLVSELVEHQGRFRALYEYSTDLFDERTIRRLHAHFEALLRSAVAAPATRIRDLALFDAEDARLLAEWNATELEHDRSRAVHQLFEASARARPEAIAVLDGSRSYSFAELEARANRLARVLRDHGVTQRSLVAVCVDRTVDMPLVLAAVHKAGAAYVPLDPAHPSDRLRYVLEDAGVACAVTLSRFKSLLGSEAKVIALDELDAELAAVSPEPLGLDVRPEDLAYVIYTSGSTGKPKGVEVEHRNVVAFLEAMRLAPGFVEGDRLLAVTTLSFDIAGLEMWLPLMVGGKIVVASRGDVLDGERLMALLVEHDITVLQATPATFRLLLEAGWSGKRNLKVLCGGEALPRDLAIALWERVGELWNVYGPTETTIWSTTCRIQDPRAAITVGHPIQNTRIYVLEPSGQPAPVGVPGELCIAGEGVARGYRNRPELTAEKFVTITLPDGKNERIYRTGDVARLRNDGSIDFLGRRDHQVKVRGYRIELGEIEAVLAADPDVKECVVSAREDTPGDVRLVAYFVPQRGKTVDLDVARATLRSKLPEYMVPNLFVSLEALPLTPNGKIDRKALPAPASGGAPTPASAALEDVPMTPIQRRVLASWREVLRVERVGLYDNFFDIGGHSLLVVKLHAALKREFSAEIELVDLFQWTTVAAQAERLSSEGPGRSAIDRAKARAARQADG